MSVGRVTVLGFIDPNRRCGGDGRNGKPKRDGSERSERCARLIRPLRPLFDRRVDVEHELGTASDDGQRPPPEVDGTLCQPLYRGGASRIGTRDGGTVLRAQRGRDQYSHRHRDRPHPSNSVVLPIRCACTKRAQGAASSSSLASAAATAFLASKVL